MSVAEEPAAGTRTRHPRGGAWIRFGHLGGVGLYLDPVVLLLFALVILAGPPVQQGVSPFVTVLILLGSLLLHELGHAFMARRLGLVVSGIYLHLFPFAYVERGRPSQELRVALAGPAVNLVVAGALLLVPAVGGGFPLTDPARWFLHASWVVIGINLAMGVINLVPALPADGGRALRAALLTRFDKEVAYGITARVGTFVGVAVALAGLAFGVWPDNAFLVVLGAFLCVVAWREAKRR